MTILGTLGLGARSELGRLRIIFAVLIALTFAVLGVLNHQGRIPTVLADNLFGAIAVFCLVVLVVAGGFLRKERRRKRKETL